MVESLYLYAFEWCGKLGGKYVVLFSDPDFIKLFPQVRERILSPHKNQPTQGFYKLFHTSGIVGDRMVFMMWIKSGNGVWKTSETVEKSPFADSFTQGGTPYGKGAAENQNRKDIKK